MADHRAAAEPAPGERFPLRVGSAVPCCNDATGQAYSPGAITAPSMPFCARSGSVQRTLRVHLPSRAANKTVVRDVPRPRHGRSCCIDTAPPVGRVGTLTRVGCAEFRLNRCGTTLAASKLWFSLNVHVTSSDEESLRVSTARPGREHPHQHWHEIGPRTGAGSHSGRPKTCLVRACTSRSR